MSIVAVMWPIYPSARQVLAVTLACWRRSWHWLCRKQAEKAAPPAGAGCKAALGGSANSSEPAAAAAADAAKQAAATAAAAAEAASNAAHEQKQKDEAAKRKHEEEVADMVAVRNEVRIAMDDALTIFDHAPRSGCPAPQQVKEASWVAFVIPVQSYVRGRPSQAMPCFQMKYLVELQWLQRGTWFWWVAAVTPLVFRQS